MSCQKYHGSWEPAVIKERYIGSEELTLMLTHNVSGQFDLYQ